MELTSREIWTSLHGMGFGALFLLGFSGIMAVLGSYRTEDLTGAGLTERSRQLKFGMLLLTILAWFTVLSGTWIVYPWYRATPPAGTIHLAGFPQKLLLSSKSTEDWHEFGMEWKEHIAWIVPIVVTSVAFCVLKYGSQLATMRTLRRALIWMLGVTFVAAAVAGAFGAFINKMAPTR